MSVHGIDMYITHYVHTMSVRVYDMFVVIFGFGIYMSTHIVKFTNMSATCLSPSIGQRCRWHVYTMYVHLFAMWSGFQMWGNRAPTETQTLEAAKPTGRDWRLILCFLALACQQWLLNGYTIRFQVHTYHEGNFLVQISMSSLAENHISDGCIFHKDPHVTR